MYRHTLKRFPVDRIKDEDFDTFLNRVISLAKDSSKEVGQELCLSTDFHISYISDKQIPSKNGCLKNTIITAVVEINEIPQEVKTDMVTLLIYHDEVKQEEDGKIKDIDYNNAAMYIQETMINLGAALAHVEQIGEQNEQ